MTSGKLTLILVTTLLGLIIVESLTNSFQYLFVFNKYIGLALLISLAFWIFKILTHFCDTVERRMKDKGKEKPLK
jgi:hypothetical protein